eukprot:TRINITY_DN2023_c0_g1_i1.p1 TRINITY_DN2023_c0_g1~~TRINITY_DN2023_c0_g1_i1.p1  ORF type:complete len:765 (-),score=210.83 TRINITY_DN2023_c0_g1_i1:22-2316(-)
MTTMMTEENLLPDIRTIRVSADTLVILLPIKETLYFYGRGLLYVLKGVVSLCGATIAQNPRIAYPVYAPFSSVALAIQTLTTVHESSTEVRCYQGPSIEDANEGEVMIDQDTQEKIQEALSASDVNLDLYAVMVIKPMKARSPIAEIELRFNLQRLSQKKYVSWTQEYIDQQLQRAAEFEAEDNLRDNSNEPQQPLDDIPAITMTTSTTIDGDDGGDGVDQSEQPMQIEEDSSAAVAVASSLVDKGKTAAVAVDDEDNEEKKKREEETNYLLEMLQRESDEVNGKETEQPPQESETTTATASEQEEQEDRRVDEDSSSMDSSTTTEATDSTSSDKEEEEEKLDVVWLMRPSVVGFYPFTKVSRDQFGLPVINITPQWEATISNFTTSTDQPPRILICGKKNYGKSFFGKITLNSLLSYHKRIAYIDLDLGQPEFTPSGFVSLTIVDKPIFGPAWSHSRVSFPQVKYYMGDVAVQSDPDFYLALTEKVFDYYKNELLPQKMPLIVNTGGWIADMGLNMLMRNIAFLSPNFIVQLLYNEAETCINFSQCVAVPNPPTIYLIDPARRDLPLIQIPSKSERDVQLLSYFNMGSLSLTETVPYLVNWKSMALKVMFHEVPPSQIMYSLNASLVSLCVEDYSHYRIITKQPSDETRAKAMEQNMNFSSKELPKFLRRNPVCKSVGLGIIRSIDMKARLFHIITPVPKEELLRVNTILKGNVSLPFVSFYKGLGVNLPYLVFGSLKTQEGGSSAIKRRTNLKRKSHVGNVQ